ncbi:hypothetical protein XMD530_001798 [Marinobacterium sp. xm-d-530]|nr:hypothetical protein [Marinobacterium sp. xm-d-530]
MEYSRAADHIKLNLFTSGVDALFNLSIIRALDYGVMPDYRLISNREVRINYLFFKQINESS